jgi:hypothetical protein
MCLQCAVRTTCTAPAGRAPRTRRACRASAGRTAVPTRPCVDAHAAGAACAAFSARPRIPGIPPRQPERRSERCPGPRREAYPGHTGRPRSCLCASEQSARSTTAGRPSTPAAHGDVARPPTCFRARPRASIRAHAFCGRSTDPSSWAADFLALAVFALIPAAGVSTADVCAVLFDSPGVFFALGAPNVSRRLCERIASHTQPPAYWAGCQPQLGRVGAPTRRAVP